MSGERTDPHAAIEVVHAARGPRDIVVTTMMAARDWMTLAPNPLDMALVPSAMSHATSMGLGLALAQPDRKVIVRNGDGSMLINEFRTPAEFRAALPEWIARRGPALLVVHVGPSEGPGPRSPSPAGERACRFMHAIRDTAQPREKP